MTKRENPQVDAQLAYTTLQIADAPRVPDQIAGSPLQADARRRSSVAVECIRQQLALMPASGPRGKPRRAGGQSDRRPHRSHALRQILTDALGMPVGFPAAHESSTFSAALLAIEALRTVDSIDRAGDLGRIERTHDPEPQAAATPSELPPPFAELYDDPTPRWRVRTTTCDWSDARAPHSCGERSRGCDRQRPAVRQFRDSCARARSRRGATAGWPTRPIHLSPLQ